MHNAKIIAPKPFPRLPMMKKERQILDNDSAFELTFKNLTNPLGENPALFHLLDFDKACLLQTDAFDIRLEVLLSLIMEEERQPGMYT